MVVVVELGYSRGSPKGPRRRHHYRGEPSPCAARRSWSYRSMATTADNEPSQGHDVARERYGMVPPGANTHITRRLRVRHSLSTAVRSTRSFVMMILRREQFRHLMGRWMSSLSVIRPSFGATGGSPPKPIKQEHTAFYWVTSYFQQNIYKFGEVIYTNLCYTASRPSAPFLTGASGIVARLKKRNPT